VWLAIANDAKPPSATTVPLAVVRMHPRALAAGVAMHDVDGTTVRVFDPSKTVADLFKYRNRVGLDVALEGLRAYWFSPHRDAGALFRYADIDGVEKVMRPYLEATVA
jgi:hypothetical protein